MADFIETLVHGTLEPMLIIQDELIKQLHRQGAINGADFVARLNAIAEALEAKGDAQLLALSLKERAGKIEASVSKD